MNVWRWPNAVFGGVSGFLLGTVIALATDYQANSWQFWSIFLPLTFAVNAAFQFIKATEGK